MMRHAPKTLTTLHSGCSVPVYGPYPSWWCEHHQIQQGYTEEDWQTITSVGVRLLSEYFRRRPPPHTFPSSLLLLSGPMSGMGDPDGSIARQILHQCEPVSIPASGIPDAGIPDVARILAHGWVHPAMTDDMIRWCADIFERSPNHQMRRLAALVVSLGAELPDVRDRLPDDLIDRIIAFGRWGVRDGPEKEAYLPVLRSLVTHLAHRQPVDRWIQQVIDQPHLGRDLLVSTMASMDPSDSVPEHIPPLILRLLDGDLTPKTMFMAARWMGNPECRSGVESLFDRAIEDPSLRPHVLAALTQTEVSMRYLPLVDQALASQHRVEQEWALDILCRWMKDVEMSATILDRITDFVKRTGYRTARLMPTMLQSYRSLARAGAMLDPRVIDTMLHHCQTFYDIYQESIAETLGGLLESGTPDVAKRALRVCQTLMNPWNRSSIPLVSALCRGLAGPCAQEVSDILMSLEPHSDAHYAVVDALMTIPASDRGQAYREQVAIHSLTALSQQVYPPPNLRDTVAWVYHHLPPSTAHDIVARFAWNQTMDMKHERLYPLIGILAHNNREYHHEAWNACAAIRPRDELDDMTVLDAWLWGMSIAPADSAPWLMYCSRHHPGLQDALHRYCTSS
jgi:hypothetical protein